MNPKGPVKISRWLFSALSFLFSISVYGADCSSALTFISLKDVTPQIYYMRVHPSGEYLLLSGWTSVIVDLRDPKHPQAIQTLMNKEAYPVEASKQWRWIASPNHSDKMRYYDFQDLLAKNAQSQAVFEDGELNQFYHSSAELPGSSKNKMHFRTSIWTLLKYRDYTAYFDGNVIPKKVEKTKTKELCPNLKNVGFRQPILSKDGSEIAGLTANKDGHETTKVFKINKNNTCTLDYDVGFNTGKVSFSYPKAGEKPLITFAATIATKGEKGSVSRTMRAGVWVFDPNKNQTFPISPSQEGFTVNYPGFTEDGRIFYMSTMDGRFGVTIADAVRLMSPACQ